MKKRKLSSVSNAAPSTSRKRPDVSKKKQEAKFYDNHVIKCTLGTFSKFQVVTDEIQSCVYWMSRLMVHTSHVMTLMLLDKNGSIPMEIEDKKKPGETKDIGMYGLYNKIMRIVANVFTDTERSGTNPDILRYCEQYAEAVGIERGSWPGKCCSGWRGKSSTNRRRRWQRITRRISKQICLFTPRDT